MHTSIKSQAYTNEQVNFTKEVPLSETTVEVQSVIVYKGRRNAHLLQSHEEGDRLEGI